MTTLSSIIDTVCAYFNTLSSFFSTIQRLKNEYHANDIDYTAVLLKLLREPSVAPYEVGSSFDLYDQGDEVYERVLLSALVSLAVYHAGQCSDWTRGLAPVLRSAVPSSGNDPWRRGKLGPVVIHLHESHYMTSSKAHVYMAIYKPLGCVVLSLPGTNNKTDWLSNLHSTTTDFSLARGRREGQGRRQRQGRQSFKVHAGFLYIAECLHSHPLIVAYLEAAASAGFGKLLLCGHSQAGAVVSLLSLLLERDSNVSAVLQGARDSQQRHKWEVQVVTFGSGACIRSDDEDDDDEHGSTIGSDGGGGGGGVTLPECLSFVRCVQSVSPSLPSTSLQPLEGWQVDPVPLLDDDALLSTTQGASAASSASTTTEKERKKDEQEEVQEEGEGVPAGRRGQPRKSGTQRSIGLTPMGQLLTLLERAVRAPASSSATHIVVNTVRRLSRGELRSLFRHALMNFSADPHAMKGYVRAVLSLSNRGGSGDRPGGDAGELDEESVIEAEYFAMVHERESEVEESRDSALAKMQLLQN